MRRAEALILFYLLVFLFPFIPGAAVGSEGGMAIPGRGKAIIYYNEACHDCAGYIQDTLIPLLKEWGVKEILKKDYINQPTFRRELFELKQRLGIPLQMQGHLTTFVNRSLILEGHVPSEMIQDAMKLQGRKSSPYFVIYQDDMKKPAHYQIWAGRGEPKTFPIDVPISRALGDPIPQTPQAAAGGKLLPSAVMVAGLLDGINPCAFAVLLFFIALLFTLKRTRQSIFWMGFTYVLAIYVTYVLIGVGLLKAFTLSSSPHLMAKVGASLVILLGAVHIKDYFFPGLPISLRVPKAGEHAIVHWATQATFPAAFVSGVLVGLCTFPCSGGIYVATIGLLQSKLTFLKGFGYLLLYNLMFVLPLVAILIMASSKAVTGKLLHEKRIQEERIHLLYGTTMIGVGIALFVWFV